MNRKKRERYGAEKPRYQANRKAYYLKHQERLLAYSRNHYRKNRAKHRHNSRSWELKQYGLTHASYAALAAAQKNKCKICGIEPKVLAVDHSHTTNRVRGLLCGHCNCGLGHFKDSKELLNQAAAYLEQGGSSDEKGNSI